MDDLEDIEIELLLEAVWRRYGFDFREYARASLRRRIAGAVASEGLSTISALQDRVLRDPECMERLLLGLTVHVTSMFRDPSFYRSFRDKVVPLLRTWPFIRLWLAGCSTGEEVYSMAILLHEADLYKRSRIYATDLSAGVLRIARHGIYPLSAMKDYTENYVASVPGDGGSFSDYYTADHQNALMRPWLLDNVVFSQHNLVTDASFNEFHVVLCRNVMIYFNKLLAQRVLGVLHASLARFGIVGLGRRETLRFAPLESHYEELDRDEKLYRRRS